MKISIDVDCTPEEARAFLGLPDVAPLQEAMMREIEERMRTAVGSADPETLFKTWLPGLQGWEQMQQFWRGMAGAGTAAGPGSGTGKSGGKPGQGG